MSTKEEIRQRVDLRCSTFKVGDSVESMVDGVEVEGQIASIDGNHAKLNTSWGEFTIWLAIWLAITTKLEPDTGK